MNLSVDTNQLLKTYESMKQEINASSSKQLLTLKEALEHIALREMQLKSVIEISEKILHRFENKLHSKKNMIKRDDPYNNDPNIKLQNLEIQFALSEEALRTSRSEIKLLKSQITKLEKSKDSNNLFTVEVYQSEIEDMKKDYRESITELESKNYFRTN